MDRPKELVEDPWLADQMDRPALRILPGPIGPETALRLRAWLRMQPEAFASARLPVSDVRGVARLTRAGFAPVDVAVTLERDGSPLAAEVRAQGVTVRPARPADQEPVAALAGRVFRWSRFHRDPRIPRSVADRIKAQWVRGFFAGTRGSALSVAVRRGQVVGFLLALEPEPGLCVIDLIGVEQAERGCGLAVLLTEHARRRGAGIERMRVGTQLSNLPALRAYLRMGFQIVASHQVLHRHGPAGRRARATPKAALAAGA